MEEIDTTEYYGGCYPEPPEYEEELIANYVPSHFKEKILDIIKGVDSDD